MAPTVFSWRHFLVVPITEEISKYLVEDFERISKSQIEKLELDIQQIVSESKELDIRTKIENTFDSMENLVNLYQQGDLLTIRTIGCFDISSKS
ncbi:hypothetical protein PGH12_05670 [Chryseobacterium wangxinyae]|uniref:hypothetical protein n=1 Tax=Chryseobacterium sp. CY350 TaxID=2997336 RepID=UPI002270F7D7|nr:hypothetical protein [Chryseobacterium sp. CY350]MCY0976637.1 hypothetical protein [Chryseobacterium sp. CY350]WBZ96638.1 hypothetical protein PGH12_05670 [Chryseobacterium sp. CY350]